MTGVGIAKKSAGCRLKDHHVGLRHVGIELSS